MYLMYVPVSPPYIGNRFLDPRPLAGTTWLRPAEAVVSVLTPLAQPAAGILEQPLPSAAHPAYHIYMDTPMGCAASEPGRCVWAGESGRSGSVHPSICPHYRSLLQVVSPSPREKPERSRHICLSIYVPQVPASQCNGIVLSASPHVTHQQSWHNNKYLDTIKPGGPSNESSPGKPILNMYLLTYIAMI